MHAAAAARGRLSRLAASQQHAWARSSSAHGCHKRPLPLWSATSSRGCGGVCSSRSRDSGRQRGLATSARGRSSHLPPTTPGAAGLKDAYVTDDDNDRFGPARPHPPPGARGVSTSSSNSSSSGNVSLGQRVLAAIPNYAKLSKYRLSTLVVFTTAAGYAAGGGPIEVVPFAGACCGTAMASAAASTFNQVIEVENDRKMQRTKARPLPAGLVSRANAAVWGASMSAASVGVLAETTDPLTTALGAGNIFLYSVVYTLSKTRTELNTWIGSFVGAVPPLMGWVASGGDLCAAEPFVLGGYLFLWQFPHFFALNWMYRQDYARGGFKMVSCDDPTGSRTADLITRYSLYMVPLPVFAASSGTTSWMFALEGTALNAWLLHRAWRFSQDPSNAKARDVFHVSLWYLPLALALFAFHNKAWYSEGVESETEREMGLEAPLVRAMNRLRLLLKERACVHEVLSSEERTAYCPSSVDVPEKLEAVGESVGRRTDEVVKSANAAAATAAAATTIGTEGK